MLNQANYESYVDPNGGSWIRINHKSCKDIVWRPSDLGMTEDGQITFSAEFLDGPGINQVTEENYDDFGRIAKAIITDIIAAEQAEVEQMAEAYEQQEQAPVEEPEAPQLSDRLSEIDILQGGTQVSSVLMPQDIQADLAQISSVLGGLKDA